MIDGPTYRLSETLARQGLPNWHLAEDHRVPFDVETFAKNPMSNRELFPIFDTFQEHRFDSYMREWGGLSADDLETVLDALCDSVLLQLAVFPDRKPRLPGSTILACFSVYKKLTGWAPEARTVLEVGPGTGFLSLFMKNLPSLERYSQVEACPGFYLLQSMVNDFAFPYRVEERALPQHLELALDFHSVDNSLFEEPCCVDLPRRAPRCVHYPWWRTGELMKQPGTVDVVTSNANLREFSPQALHDYLALFKRVLKPGGVVLAQCLGGELWTNHAGLVAELRKQGFAPIVYELEGGEYRFSGPGLPSTVKNFCTGNALLVGPEHPLFEKYDHPEYFNGCHFGDEAGVLDMFLPQDGPRQSYSLDDLRERVSSRLQGRLEGPAAPGPKARAPRARTCGPLPLQALPDPQTQSMTPVFFAPRIKALVQAWRARSARVLIYAAGEHTRRLARCSDLMQANIIGVVDSSPRQQNQEILGFTVQSPEAIPELRPDVILVSSAIFQEEIYRSLAPFEAMGIQVVRIYETRDPSAGA